MTVDCAVLDDGKKKLKVLLNSEDYYTVWVDLNFEWEECVKLASVKWWSVCCVVGSDGRKW